MASFNDQVNPGAFVPETDIFDTQQIYDLDVNSREFKEFLVRLRQSMNDMALVLNIKNSGIYYPQEFVTGQIFFPNPELNSTTSQSPAPRPVFRQVVITGALPATTKSVPHNIDFSDGFQLVDIYGGADAPGVDSIRLPYASPTANDSVSVKITPTNVVLTTGVSKVAYTRSRVIIEYLKC